MPNFFSNLAQLAGDAVAPTADVVAANNYAQTAQADKLRQQKIQDVMMKRQADQDTRAADVATQRIKTMQSQAAAADALAGQRNTDPVYTKPGADGQYYQFPRRIPRGTVSAGSLDAGGPAASADPDAFAVKPWSLTDSAAPMPNSGQQGGGAPKPPTAPVGQGPTPPQGPTLAGRPTGVFAPAKPPAAPRATTATINGRQVLGRVDAQGMFSPDTTAQGDTVYGRPPTGAGANVAANQTLVNIRGQIAQTQSQLRSAQSQARAANDPLAPASARQQAVGAAMHAKVLQQRLDSLTAVHDRLSAQQQAGVPPIGQPATAPASPPGDTPGAPDRTRQMQGEFDDASHDLTAVLNSNAPDTIKQRARELYDQHQVAIAQKYRVTSPGNGAAPTTPPLDQ